jgi:hypothetical protein
MDKNTLHSNLREYVNQNPPDWAGNIMEEFTVGYRELADKYASSKYWSSNESLNIQDIAGTEHPDYAGGSWLNLLNNGKRMQSVNLPLLSENPGYYYENELKKPNMEYVRIDDKTFIIEGNYRTCIARFLFHYQGLAILHGVTLEAYTIDYCFKRVFERLAEILMKYPCNLSLERRTLSRQDTAGWYREYYELKAVLVTERGKYQLFTGDMEEMIVESYKPMRRLFGKYKHIWRSL